MSESVITGRPQANADDLDQTPQRTGRFNPEALKAAAARPRVYDDPRATKPTANHAVQPDDRGTPATTPEDAQALVERLRRQRAAEEQNAAPVAAEEPPAAPKQVVEQEDPRLVQQRLLHEAERNDPRPAPRNEQPVRRADPRPVRRDDDRPVNNGRRAESERMATQRSNGARGGRLSRWNLPNITRQTNRKPLYVQTSEGLLADRTALGDQFPKFMVFVTVIGIILSVGSTINAVQFVIGKLAERGVLGITLVAAADGTMGMSTGWKFVAIVIGSTVAGGIAWGQAQLSDQLTNNQSLAFWTLELLDMGMTFFFISPVVSGILSIILEMSPQAFYTAAGAEIAIVCAFVLNQSVKAKRMDEELDPFWFKAFLIIFFVVGNIISRAVLPLFGDPATVEGMVAQIRAAAFGINSFISFLSAYVPEQTAFGSRLRRVGRKDTASGNA